MYIRPRNSSNFLPCIYKEGNWMFTLNEFRYVNYLLYLCVAINLLYYS